MWNPYNPSTDILTIEQSMECYKDIKDKLEKLINSTEQNKEKEAASLIEQAREQEGILKEAIKRINDNSKNVTETELNKVREAEKLLENISGEIKNLYNNITSSESPSEKTEEEKKTEEDKKTWEEEKAQEDKKTGEEEKPEEDKKAEIPETKSDNIFSKAKDWIWDQWKDVWDEKKWETEWWLNLLRTAWFVATWVWAVSLAYKGIKKLFWWGKDEEAEEEEEKPTKKKKKKPFFDRWYWKAIKWWLIITWGYWLGKNFGWWGTDEDNPTDKETPEVKYKAFEKLDQESKETYNALWNQIDNTYEKMFDRELKAWYQDEMNMERIAREVNWDITNTWVIPFCLDNKFWTVEDLMWQNHSITEAIRWWVQKMIGWLKTAWNNVLETFASDYLSKLPSWTGMKFVATTLEWKVEEWAKKNVDTQKELEYFFRQSIRVERYFFEKKRQLEYILADRVAKALWKKATEVLDDDSLYEEYIENDPTYQNFLHSNLLASANILKNEKILDDSISPDTVTAVEELDEKRDEILGKNQWDGDVIQSINKKVDNHEDITQSEKTLLSNACTKLSEDIENSIIPALKDSPLSVRENLLWTSDNPEIKKYIQKGWLMELISNFRNVLSGDKQKIDSWEISTEEIREIAWRINDLLALKKEIILWAWTIWMEDWNIIFKWYEWIYWSLKNLYKWVKKLSQWDLLGCLEFMASGLPGVWAWIIVLGWWYQLIHLRGQRAWKMVKVWWKIWAAPLYPVYLMGKKSWLWRCLSAMSRNLLSKSKRLQRLQFMWENGCKRFKQALQRWEITLSDASDILARKVDSLDPDVSRQRLDEFKLDKTTLTTGVESDELFVKKCLFDDYFLSKNWWDTSTSRQLLSDLKKDKDLYEKAIKYFDSCPEVKQHVINWWNINGLRTAINAHEQNLANLARRTPDKFSPKCEEAWKRSSLKNEFDVERSRLEENLKTKEDAKVKAEEAKRKARGTWRKQAEKNLQQVERDIQKAKKELESLDNIEKEVKTSMMELENSTSVRKLDTALDNLLWDTEKIAKKLSTETGGTLLDVMKNAKSLNDFVDSAVDSTWKRLFNSVDELLDQLNWRFITDLMTNHPHLKIPNATKTLIDKLSDIKVNGKAALNLADDVMSALKYLFRISKAI